jgi:hypothetical protein
MKGDAMMRQWTLALALGLIASSGSAVADDWRTLLAGDKLRGWEAANGGDAFRITDGTLSVDGIGQIVYVGEGKPLDLTGFELQAEVLTRPGSRAGLAFHVPTEDSRSSGGLEVRLDNSYGPPAPGRALLKTGSLVWLRPIARSVVPDDRWFSLSVRVQGRRVEVRVDRQLLVDYVEPEKVESGPRLKHGTLSVRGHDGSGAVLIRNLRVRPLAEGRSVAAAVKRDATDLRLAGLREQGFSLVDFHTHLKGGLTLDDVLAHSRQTGIGAGVAVNCGQGFPVADDRAARAFLDGVRGKPVFVGMQAEGREWVRLFSPATVARFDYVFTDAMTLTDPRGRRVRLWVKEEVDVPDAQAFMDRLVKTIENILDREPIDFYANPTYLPDIIAKDYDRLWTPERMRRVVAALARNGVALEINDRLRLPKAPLIKMAKEAGVKFTFGTNNSDRTLGRLEYGLRMIEECALTPDDLWAPRPDGQKPVQVRRKE